MRAPVNLLENRIFQKVFVPLIVAVGVFAAGSVSAAEGDPVAGKRVFAQCSACHTVVKGKNGLGPSLHGVVGRKAGTAEGFKNYSPAIQRSDIVWTEENLAKYLKDPKGFIPGNRMILAGMKKDEDIANVIAYIEQAAKE